MYYQPAGNSVYTIHVPQNATGVGAQLTSAPGSYLNMYLLDCTKPAHNSESPQSIVHSRDEEHGSFSAAILV